MPEQELDERFCWVVILRKYGKVYTYIRTESGMAQVVDDYRAKNNGANPYRMWVIVDDEIQKVVIS